jgi:hypothetical protein
MEIFRNVLPDTELETVQSILSGSAWKFGYVSNDKNKPIWNFDKMQSLIVAETIIKHLPEYILDDFHVNGQTNGQVTAVHQDSTNGSTHAFVYFPFHWNYTNGGRLHIFKNNIPQSITPELNLGVLFDASLPHYAEGPTENLLRISVGLKLRKK